MKGVFLLLGVFLVDGQQKIQLAAPAMTEEDQLSPLLADKYKCNACQAVRHKLEIATEKMSRASETVLVSLFEETCKWRNFQGYGISMINGKNVLTGPGVKTETDKSNSMGSIQMGGEIWSRRLGGFCVELVDEFGESEIFNIIKKRGNFCKPYCSGNRQTEL